MILGEPIILGGGGGIPVEIIVNTEAGAGVLAINGITVLSAVADENGKATLKIKKEGTWIIQASLNGETVETTIFIEHKISEEFPFIDPVLANNSWEKISEVARAGKASQYWNVGDTKPIVLSGEEYTAQIVDFDHYDVDDPTTYGREKAGIVFQFKDVVESLLSCSDTRTYINDWITNYCDCSEFVPTIKFPKRLYSNKYDVGLDVAKGISASEMELLGTYSNEGAQVGTQYAFYAAGNSRVKYSKGTTTKREWWTRSLGGTSTSNYVYINTSGSSAKTSNSNTKRCAPVFCL